MKGQKVSLTVGTYLQPMSHLIRLNMSSRYNDFGFNSLILKNDNLNIFTIQMH